MKTKQVLEILGCTRQSLCKYVKQGIIGTTLCANGRYDYHDDDVYAFIGRRAIKRDRLIVSYSRVSTTAQRNQLKEQTARIYGSCISRGLSLDMQLEDIKSGMASDRQGFQKLCQLVIEGRVATIVIENKDRLMRFGYELFEQFFKYFGTTILVLNDSLDNKSYEMELSEDLISIIHYFTMKSYSHRRKLNKLRRELEHETQEHR